MSKLLCFALSIALLALTKADHPLTWYKEFVDDVNDEIPDFVGRNDETLYRLPENVVPLDYDIYLDIYFDERTEKPYSFEGKENIVIEAIEENVNQIVLHANVDSINSVTLFDVNGLPVVLNNQNPFEIVPLSHFLKVNLAGTMNVGVNYTLNIEYSNTMNEGPLRRGLWRGWYIDGNGNERIYATTHFQPYNARQVFPCWDEPLFKAVYKVHLTRPVGYDGTFSNTRLDSRVTLTNNRVQDNFAATPKMSSYLVTFLVSESFTVIAEDTSLTPAIRIIGRSNTVGLADRTLELAVKMTEYFDSYLGISYSSLHPNLYNDHISSPDWASAGTENWGMVSYRELYMITDPSETIMSVEHYAATLISHELAHKWFGNLITCYWWSNTWINEGYASYFGYLATNQVFPEYEHADHFNSRYLQAALSVDSAISTVPMNHGVNTPAQVTGHFGTISYHKAASFLRMTVNIISEATFQKSCNYFLRNNAYEPTDQYDLLEAFTQAIEEDNSLADYSNFNFAEYYRVWVNEPGFPILNVDINHSTGEISLSQERFFLSATATPTGQIYPIPITYSTRRNPNFSNLKPVFIMNTPNAVTTKDAGEEWVIFNNLQQGFYRVNYDDRTWTLIAEALLDERESIHYMTRAQIVDDVFALMRSSRMSYSYGFNILKFLRNEDNFHVWDPAITGYTWLRNRLRHIPEKQAEFDAFILSYLDHAIETLGFGPIASETPTTNMARAAILHFACMIGSVKCVEPSWELYVAMRDNNAEVSTRVLRNVYVTGVREGDSNDFQFMLNRMRQSNYANNQLEMLRALGATRDPESLNRFLKLTLTQEVRHHDKVNAFNYALLGNPDNAYKVLQFVKENIDEMRVQYQENAPPVPVQTALSNLAAYLDEPGLVEYEEWLQSTQVGTAQYSTSISAIASARNNMAWGTANADIILTAARDSGTMMVTSLTMLFTLTLLSILT